MGSRPISSSSGGCCRERQNRTANTETPPRIARGKGDVCKSQDVPSALTVLALSVYIVVMGGQLLESLLAMMELPMKLLSTPYAEAAPRAAKPRST